MPKLRVVPRSTVFRYKSRDIEPQSIGDELNVRAVLTGRVSQRGNTLEVQIDLVDIAKRSQIWGYHCHQELADLLTVRDEIVQITTEKLQLKLSGEEKRRLTRRYTDNVDAFQFYLKGRFHWNKRTPEGFKKGIDYFQRAIDKDPRYARLTPVWQIVINYCRLTSCSGRTEAFPKAKAAALKALEIDDRLTEAHASLGFARQFFIGIVGGRTSTQASHRDSIQPMHRLINGWASTTRCGAGSMNPRPN